MKYNKTVLLVVVMILALSVMLLGCPGPAGDNKTLDFLGVGGSYLATATSVEEAFTFAVVEIRHDGWILAEFGPDRYGWINTTQLVWIEEW